MLVVTLLIAVAACASSSGKTTPQLTQQDYDAVADAYVVGVDADSPILDSGELAAATFACEIAVPGFMAVAGSWEKQLWETYPDAFERIEYDNVVACLREAGMEIADSTTESLTAALEANRPLYLECFDEESMRVMEAEPGICDLRRPRRSRRRQG